jgi:uncharacterized repeat protein (TIGR01451 family)
MYFWRHTVKSYLKPLLFACSALVGVSPAFAAIDVNNSFSPATLYPTQVSRITLRLQNSSLNDSVSVNLPNVLPNGVFIASTPNINNTCGGSVSATNDASKGTITLTAGTIPHGDGTNPGFCLVQVDVVANSKGTYINTIASGALTGITNGTPESNATAASATLAVILQDLSGSISSPLSGILQGNETAVQTITLTNPNPVALTGMGFTYDLWNSAYNVRIRDDLPMSNTCGATMATSVRPARTTEVGTTSQLVISGGTIPASGSCQISYTIEPSRDPLRPYYAIGLTHAIAANTISVAQGATNSAAIQGSVSTYTGQIIYKYFNNAQTATTNINDTANAALRFNIINYNAAPITGINFTDAMPAGMTVSAIGSNTCGGTVTNSPNTDLTLTGGSMLGGTPGVNGLQAVACDFYATTQVAGAGTYNNTVPAGTFNGSNQFASTYATLTVNGEMLGISKTLTRNGTLYAGDTLNANFSITNYSSATPVTNLRIPDDLATMGYGFRVGSAGLISNTCGGSGTVVPDATSFQMTGLSVAPGQTCTFSVGLATSSDALRTSINEYRTNTIPAGTILYNTPTQTDVPFGLAVSSSIWMYYPVLVYKNFTPNTVGPLGITRLRIDVNRYSSDRVSISGMSILDNLPAGHVVAPTPNPFNGCGGTLNATPGSGTVELTGANMTFPVGTSIAISCSYEVNVKVPALTAPATTQTATNVIPGDPHGATPRANPRVYFIATDNRQSAPYNEVRNLYTSSAAITRRATSVTANKEFLTPTINGGGVSRVRITLSNLEPTSINLTGVSLTDWFGDTDMRLYSNVDPTYTDLAGNPNANGCTGGTFVGTPGSNQIALSGATISALRACRFEFNVTAFKGGNHINRLFQGDLVTAEGITNNSDVSATLTVGYQIGVGKGFSPSVIQAGGTSLLTLDIYNTNVSPNDQTGASPAIIDEMPAGLQIVPGTAATTCVGGTASSGVNAGLHFLRLDGGLFPASGVCKVTAQVTSSTTGVYLNQIPVGALRSDTGSQSPDPAEARIRVIQHPTISKSFSSATIPANGVSTLTFNIANPNSAALLPTGMNGIAFSDTLTNMQIAAPLTIGGSCTGYTHDAVIGGTSLNISNVSVAPGSNCSISVPVTSSTIGLLPNQTTGATSNQTTAAGPPSNVANLRVIEPLTIAKSFATASVAPGSPVRMTFTLTNPNPVTVALNNPGFTDLFPTTPGTMVVAPTPNLSTTCAGTVVRNYDNTAAMAAGNNGVYIYGSNVNANSSCQISFDVRVSASGNYTNTTSAVSSAGGNSAAASAPLFGLSIAATNDSVGGIAGVSGATAVLNAFTGDTISGTPATTANSTLAVSTAVPAQLTFDTATGNVDVKPNTPAGTYSFNYQICDNTNPLNCTTATISVTVAPSADLSVTKTNTPGVNGDVDQTSDAVTTGTATTYTIIVRNNGPDTITGPIVSDTIGTGLTCPASNVVTITGSGVPVGSFNVGNLTGTGITLGTLTNGQTTRISYSCQVN